jgi:hypothetical protein
VDADGLYFGALLRRGTALNLRGVQRDYITPQWQRTYDFVLDFVKRSGTLPHAQTVEQSLNIKLPEAPEGIEWYADKVRHNAMRIAMEEGFFAQVAKPLGEQKVLESLEGAKDVVTRVTRDFLRQQDRGLTLDYSSNVVVRAQDYMLRKHAQNKLGIPFVWPSMSQMTGGLQAGDAWAFVSRQNKGKSWVLIANAIMQYQMGYRVLFASMETPPQSAKPRSTSHRVIRNTCIRCFEVGVQPTETCPAAVTPRQRLSLRFDAVGSRLCAWRLLKGGLSPNDEMRLRDYYAAVANPTAHGWGDLRIVAAPLVKSVTDLTMEVAQFDPDIVYWDSAAMAATRGGGEGGGKHDRKERTDELIGDFKEMVEQFSIPGVVSWHFNRDVDDDATAAQPNDIAHSDEMVKRFDGVIGFFRTREMKAAGEGLFKPMKIRDGLMAHEIKTMFRVKDEINFREISSSEAV